MNFLLSEEVLILFKLELCSSGKDSRKKCGDSDIFRLAIPLKIISEIDRDSALRNRLQYKSASLSLQAN